MNLAVTKKEFEQLKTWEKAFNRADRCKNLCYYHLQYIVPHNTLDKRMDAMWKAVSNVEPFPTFINGVLTNKAWLFLAQIRIHNSAKDSKLFTIID
jgi:hypothetical protein